MSKPAATPRSRAGGWCRRGLRQGAPGVLRSGGGNQATGVLFAAALAALAVLWLATRPYLGIVHDAQLYAIQAIAWRDPARFAEDLFFAFGSQDRFSVFSSLYGPLVAWFGPPVAHALTLALAQSLWLGGAWVLASALLPELRLRLWALAALILLPSSYGYLGLLRIGEPFVTARPFVEAATMAALGLALRGRMLLPVLLLLGAATLHPLLAVPGLGLVVLLRVMDRPRLAAALLALGLLAACLPALLPDGLVERLGRMDEDWLAVVRATVKMTLLGEWGALDHARTAFRLLLALVLLSCLDGMARRLVAAATLLALLGFLLQIAGGEVARLHLVVAGQPWRAVWLLTCVTNLLFVPATLPLWRAPGFAALPAARANLLLLGVAMVATHPLPGLFVALPLPAALLLWQVRQFRRGAESPRLLRLAMACLFGLGLGWALAVLAVALQVHLPQHAEVPWTIPRALLLLAGGLVLLGAATRPAPSRAVRAAALAGTVVLPAIALASLDQRTPWQVFIETPGPEQAALEAFLPAEGGVFWDGGLDLLWFRLQRPSHFACVQAAGVVFFRGTALAARDRIPAFSFQRREGTCSASMAPAMVPPTLADLSLACRHEPALDFIVIPDLVEGARPAATWMLPVGRTPPNMIGEAFPPGEVHRYDCAALR
jgi:hypothetical protein